MINGDYLTNEERVRTERHEREVSAYNRKDGMENLVMRVRDGSSVSSVYVVVHEYRVSRRPV